MKASISGDHGRLISLTVPDKFGNLIDVVADYDKPAANIKVEQRFMLNLLNGKKKNISLMVRQPDEKTIELHYFSARRVNEQTGQINIKLALRLTSDNCLKLSCEAISDELMLINKPGYAFFNLNGKSEPGVSKHQLYIKADHYLPVDPAVIQTGDSELVTNTPFDFRKSAFICSRIYDHHLQLTYANGYRHCFLLSKCSPRTPVARIKGDKSGITMDFFTNQPTIFFRSNFFLANGETKSAALSRERYSRAITILSGNFFPFRPLSQIPAILLTPNQLHKSVCKYQLKS